MVISDKLRSAIAAQEAGQNEQAEALYWDILRENPNDIIALYHAGVIRFNAQDYKTAVDLVRKSLALHDNNPTAHNTLGLALIALGRPEEAVASYRKAIALDPRNPDAYNNLTIVLMDQGRTEDAVQLCRQAIASKPDSFLTYYNLGVGLQRLSKTVEAIDAFKKAISFLPAFPEAYCNLGLAYMMLGKREEAIAAYQKALEIRPNFPEALNNLGQPLNELGRLEESTEAYRKSAALRPQYADVFINLAHTLRKRGLLGEAIEACRKGLESSPHNLKLQIEIGNLRRLACDWSQFKNDVNHLCSVVKDAEPFLLLSVPTSLAEQHLCTQNWAARIPRGKAFVHNRHEHTGRIKIGYLSCDFHMHATAYLMAELIERHDRTKFELYAYSYGHNDNSDIRHRVVKGFDHFVDLYASSDDEAMRRIYKDKIDVLVDLKGYTQGTRTRILADRPAPVQVNFLGYPGTMGADFIDYVIGDPVVTPMADARYYSEKIVQLPDCYQPNDSKREIAAQTPSKTECGLPETGVVFCCFNASYKISPPFFDVWMRLLKAVPNSVLWLIAMTSEEVKANLRREAVMRGIKGERIIFAQGQKLPYHLARHRLADLFLDTLPYGAHTTASDALWAGLPIVTCLGETFAGRVSSSALRSVGLAELTTNTMAEYEAKALDLATHPEKLAAVKQKLAQNIPTAPLFDIARYTKNIEGAYVRMVELWRNGEKPKPFAIDAKTHAAK